MNQNIIKTLTKIGLNDKEIKIYLAALTMGQTSASILASKTNINRSTAQYTCQWLIDKRLMSITPKGNTFLYAPEPPEKLLSLVNKEYSVLEKKMEDTHKIMWDLNSLSNPHATLPKVKYFTGVDGIIDMFEDILNEKKDVYWFIYLWENLNFEPIIVGIGTMKNVKNIKYIFLIIGLKFPFFY